MTDVFRESGRLATRRMVAPQRTEWHIGRGWPGINHLEAGCPCIKAACGLAIQGTDKTCPEHAVAARKTMRQRRTAGHCPIEGTPTPRPDTYGPDPLSDDAVRWIPGDPQ